MRFQGQWFDEESGLHYNFHRYYDPQTARYISNDPIGLEGGFNTYGYVHNPLTLIDPFGLAGCKAESLPQLGGRRIPQIQRTLQNEGFVLRNPANPRNQRWVHPDGSEVQIHRYGNANTTPHRSGNNAHVHRSIGRHGESGTIELNDRGFPSTNPNETHIGVRNPADFPTVSGRPHGR